MILLSGDFQQLPEDWDWRTGSDRDQFALNLGDDACEEPPPQRGLDTSRYADRCRKHNEVYRGYWCQIFLAKYRMMSLTWLMRPTGPGLVRIPCYAELQTLSIRQWSTATSKECCN